MEFLNPAAMPSLSRRRLLRMGAGALLAANLWPGRSRGQTAAVKPLKFIQVNDLHYTDDTCAPFFEGMVRKFNEIPDVAHVLIVGDLVDNGTAGQVHAMHDILSGLKAPYYVTPGNHDAVSTSDRTPFEKAFGKNFNYTFETNGWQFVGLDTSDFQKVENFDCRKETLDYAAALPGKLDKAKPTFVFTHFPLGPGVKYLVQNADALLEPFKQLNVRAIFNGHYHGFTQKTRFDNVLVTTNRCCSRKRANHDGTWQKGFFVIEGDGGNYKRTFVEYGTDLPGSAKPAGARPANPATAPASQPAY